MAREFTLETILAPGLSGSSHVGDKYTKTLWALAIAGGFRRIHPFCCRNAIDIGWNKLPADEEAKSLAQVCFRRWKTTPAPGSPEQEICIKPLQSRALTATIGGPMKPARPRARKVLDAILYFQPVSPDSIQVIEMMADGTRSQHEFPRESDTIAELQKRYIFLSDQARLARKLVRAGLPCSFDVYRREP